MKKQIVLCSSCLVCFSALHATAPQYFFGINYENPAELQRVNQDEFNVGVDYFDHRFKFSGTTPVGSGSAHSKGHQLMPTAQYACRCGDHFVFALSYTVPESGVLNWGNNSIVRNTSTKTLIYKEKVGPRVCWQFCDKLSIGAGFDVNFGPKNQNQLNFVIEPFGNIKNKFKIFLYSFNAGLFYTISPQTFLSVAYYSGRISTGYGTSKAANGAVNDRFKIFLPTTWFVYGKLIHNFGDHFSTYFRVIYTDSSMLQQLKFKNTVAGDITIQTRWINTWTYELGMKVIPNENWELMGLLLYNTKFAKSRFNSVAYPSSDVFAFGVGVSRSLGCHLRAYLNYGHSLFTPKASIRNVAAGDNGHVSLNGNVFSFRMVWSL